MKRLALLLTAVALGSGCPSADECGSGSLTVDWQTDGFTEYEGTPNLDCAYFGIDFVDVYVDGDPTPAASVPCADGQVTIDGIPAGDHDVLLEGVDTDPVTGAVAVRDWTHAPVSVCSDAPTFVASPGQTDIEIFYVFAGGGGCTVLAAPFTGDVRMSFEVIDDLSGLHHTSTRNDLCGPENAFGAGELLLRVPWGMYTVASVSEEAFDADAGAWVTLRQTIGPTASQEVYDPWPYTSVPYYDVTLH